MPKLEKDSGNLTQKQLQHESNIRVQIQKQIIERWGQEHIDEASKRLCEKCRSFLRCELYPICSDGCDCPYFHE